MGHEEPAAVQEEGTTKRKGAAQAASDDGKSGEAPPPPEGAGEQRQQAEGKTFQRYYHLYKEGELEDDVRAVGGQVISHGYDRDNWWAVAANS